MEGASKNINTAITNVTTELISIASGSPNCSARVPINNEPIGSNPKNVNVYTPITRPRKLSGTRVCTRELAIFIVRIRALPKAKIMTNDIGII